MPSWLAPRTPAGAPLRRCCINGQPYLGEQNVIFPSTGGTLRDPNNFGKQWRTVRERLE